MAPAGGSGDRPATDPRPLDDRQRPRGPRGLRPPPAIDDPTISGWSGDDPSGRATLAAAESDAAYRWAAPAVRHRHVLDVGCMLGEGASLLLDAGARSVVGIDHDAGLVDAADRRHGARIRFLHAEPMALPMADDSFNAATCFRPLEETPDPEAIISGLRRILTHDGILLASLPLARAGDRATDGGAERPDAERWRRAVADRFANVRLYRRRICLAAAVAPADRPGALPIDEAAWLGGALTDEWAALAVASDEALPELPSVASLTDLSDLRAYRETLTAWEERARRAEADGSAKHWELVAAREAQRRQRKRIYELEHRPLRVLGRLVRGGPRRIGQPPVERDSERGPAPWD